MIITSSVVWLVALADLAFQRNASEVEQDTGLEHHTVVNCLGCYHLKPDSSITIKIGHVDEEGMNLAMRHSEHLDKINSFLWSLLLTHVDL